MASPRSVQLVSEAIAVQRSAGYSADTWLGLDLEPMTKAWRGVGGDSPFFFAEEDAREARGAYAGSESYQFAESLWRLAQVKPHAARGYRACIREFVVDIRTPAAVGICRANDQLGGGSLLQYYIPDWRGNLRETGREHQFPGTAFPGI